MMSLWGYRLPSLGAALHLHRHMKIVLVLNCYMKQNVCECMRSLWHVQYLTHQKFLSQQTGMASTRMRRIGAAGVNLVVTLTTVATGDQHFLSWGIVVARRSGNAPHAELKRNFKLTCIMQGLTRTISMDLAS